MTAASWVVNGILALFVITLVTSSAVVMIAEVRYRRTRKARERRWAERWGDTR